MDFQVADIEGFHLNNEDQKKLRAVKIRKKRKKHCLNEYTKKENQSTSAHLGKDVNSLA